MLNVNFHSESGYKYTRITPEELGNLPTRLELTYYVGECYFGPAPGKRWTAVTRFVEACLPELAPFEDETYSRLSHGSLPLRELVKLMNERMGSHIDHSAGLFYVHGETFPRTGFRFVDIPDYVDLLDSRSTVPRVPLLGRKFWFPRRTTYSQYSNEISLRISRTGVYGWYYHVYTDGQVEIDISNSDPAWSYRDVTLHIIAGSWCVVRGVYLGQIYDHDDTFDVYGEPPADFLAHHVKRI